MATSLIYSDCAYSINPINFGYPTIRSTTRTVVSRCCMNVIAVSTTCCDVSMFWQFSDSSQDTLFHMKIDIYGCMLLCD